MSKKYYLTVNKTILINPKVHVMFTKYIQKQFKKIIISNDAELYDFLKKTNSSETIIYHYYGGTCKRMNNMRKNILEYINNDNNKILSTIILHTNDFWFHFPLTLRSKTQNYLLENQFKAKNHKVWCSGPDLKSLNFFHNYDYSPYRNNIYFNHGLPCYQSSFIKFNENPEYKILISGSRSKFYPERQIMANLKSNYIKVYKPNNNDIITDNNNYNIVLNKHFACFSSPVHISRKNTKKLVNTHTFVCKTHEILAAGSLLIMSITEEKYIKERLGIINKVHCYLIDFNKNLIEQVNYIFENIELFDKIKKEGQKFAKENLNGEEALKKPYWKLLLKQ